MSKRAVFLDRDGVINSMVTRPGTMQEDSPYSVEEFSLLPHVAEAICLIRDAGFLAVVASNQPGIAKGKTDETTLNAITERMKELLATDGALLDDIYYCLHHPDGIVDSLHGECSCRKPKPGLLLNAARDLDISLQDSYMVGDRTVDVEAGRSAGLQTVLISPNGTAHADSLDVKPDVIADSLLAAVRLILNKA